MKRKLSENIMPAGSGRKILSLLLVFSLFFALAACGTQQKDEVTAQTEPVTIRIAGLKGPTSMGLVKLMEDAEKGETGNRYVFSLHGSADEVTPKLIQGELDMAAIPANLAAVLYNNTDGAVRVLAVNTLGVLYLVENGTSVTDFESLRGRTVYATGKGSTPEYTLRYLLSANGLDPDRDVTIEYRSEPAEVVSLLAAGEAIAMLPQPYVTAAQAKVPGLRTALDLNKAWEDQGTDSRLITGVLAARTDFIAQHPEEVQRFLEEYRASIEWVCADPAAASGLIEKYDIAKAAVAEAALPACNITFISGNTMAASLTGYLRTLYEQNPKAVGGKLPGESFCYTGPDSP